MIYDQNTQEVKLNVSFLDKTGQNVHVFKEVLIFQGTYNIKTEKQTVSSLSLCQFDAGRLAEGKGCFVLFFQLKSVLLCVLDLFSERQQSTDL